MNIERILLISLLKSTREGLVSKEIVKKDAKLLSENVEDLLRKLQNDGLVYLRKDIVEADSMQRLKLAVRAISLGADIENVSSFLQWKEFENIAAVAFERNGYTVTKNLRFKHVRQRWEIDILGFKEPIVLCVDCKHWHRGMSPSSIKKIVEDQVKRTSALAESLPNPTIRFEFASWNFAKFVPAVLSLVTGRFKFYENVPIVSVIQLQDFLSELPAYVDSLKHFSTCSSSKLNICS
jgi:Holliday junction resolvase-like predicted endonuclease